MSSTICSATDTPPAIPGLDLQDKVGNGGMSVVYRAVHRNLQRTVAVKLLRATPEDGGGSPTWLRESRLMASLAHPHVVGIHDAGQIDGHNYLVMEYMVGGSLRERMKPGQPWPLDQAVPLVIHIGQALGHIHAQGILHLDLKPENILYTADQHIKITDFGLSVPHVDVPALLGGRRFQGTLDYCAPEYRSGLALDARYDVFSLATLTYELLTGRLPGRVYLPATSRNPRLPVAIDDVLRRGLARDPSERYASVDHFLNALTNACRPALAWRRSRLAIIAAAAALLVIVPLAIYKRGNEPTPQPENPSVETPARQEANPDQPDRLVIFLDKPEDLALFTGEESEHLASGSSTTVERILISNAPRSLGLELQLPLWPTPRPALLIHSPGAWGFVHPLKDAKLGQRVVTHWPDLLRATVPADKNLVRAGKFDGDCLGTNNDGVLWRTVSASDWSANRQIAVEAPPNQPDNPALVLTNLDPARSKYRLRCYHPLKIGPPPDAVVVLRYRARSLNSKGSLAVNAVMPAEIPETETGPVAGRIRSLASPVPSVPNDPAPGRWLYWCPAWVTPSVEWQTYLTIFESPPFPTRVTHRNLVIDLIASSEGATDQIWVDDVELFVWTPGNKP